MSGGRSVLVLGAGLAGCCVALRLAQLEHRVTLVDRNPRPVSGASRHNEGKLHLGYIYAADPVHKTHQTVMAGSLSFLDAIERLTRVPREAIPRSHGFVYVVHADSLLRVDDIRRHFEEVDTLLAEHTGRAQDAAWDLPDEFVRSTYADSTLAAIHTSEIAVDSNHVASVVGAAVLAEPRIDFVGNHEVTGAEVVGDGHRIVARSPEGEVRFEAAAVANCLWENRVHVDSLIGRVSDKPWLWRWKAVLSFDTPAHLSVPPTTVVLGPFGDYVPYTSGRSYLSWYRSCLVGFTPDGGADPLRVAIDGRDDQAIRRDAIAGFASVIPALADQQELLRTARVGGGYIMALGSTDIDDPVSGLHERHEVGPSMDGAWLSLETGKFCTAPMFGVRAAEMIHERLTRS
ncbi:MAG: FAD-dependent oxidoreductase [Acidobacteria bacterium]|nr:FAD-dependent oxidoreductase [Acidobacteriota bacterium]